MFKLSVTAFAGFIASTQALDVMLFDEDIAASLDPKKEGLKWSFDFPDDKFDYHKYVDDPDFHPAKETPEFTPRQ